ncbi:MAG: hypothetical protein IKZ62_07355 [Prevotella sp.]|nr:hypothetical protein [Prevotella sp.]
MKHRMILLSTLMVIFLSACAKKVKLTIDGTLSPTQTTLYLIINEDTANAQRIPINDAKFSVTIEVDKNDFIRLHDYKEWPERSVFVLIPDSRHITINTWNGTIEGSPMSLRLQKAIKGIREAGPGTFHIDVFSEDPKAWEEARIQERAIRAHMEEEQRQVVREVMLENKDNNIPAWVLICFPEQASMYFDEVTKGSPKWMKHPILMKKKK